MAPISAQAGMGVAGATSYPAVVLADAPLGWWRLNESSGATSFADSSGNSHALTISGTPTFGATPPPGTGGGAVTFTGSQYASVATPSWFSAGSAWTLEAWVKTTSATGMGILTRDDIAEAASGADRMIQLELSSGKPATELFNGSTNFVVAASAIADGGWHHLAVTYGANTGTVYVDGTSVGTCSLTAPLGSGGHSPLVLGAVYHSNFGNSFDRFFNGSIADAAIYPTALSATRITAHYNAGKSGTADSGATAMSARAGVVIVGNDPSGVNAVSVQAGMAVAPTDIPADQGVVGMAAQTGMGVVGAATPPGLGAAPMSVQTGMAVVAPEVVSPSHTALLDGLSVATSWTGTPAGEAQLDIVRDTDTSSYLSSAADPTSQELTGPLQPLLAPGPGLPLTVQLQVDQYGGTGGSVTAHLMQGASVVSTAASATLPDGGDGSGPVTGTVTLTFPVADLAAVTDWNTLSLQLLFSAA